MALGGPRAAKLWALVSSRLVTADAAQQAYESDSRAQLALLVEEAGKLDADLKQSAGDKWEKWKDLAEPEKTTLGNRIIALEKDLAALTDAVGPADPRSFMAKQFASNGAMIGLAVYCFAGIVGTGIVAANYWEEATVGTEPPTSVSDGGAGHAGSGETGEVGAGASGGDRAAIRAAAGASGSPGQADESSKAGAGGAPTAQSPLTNRQTADGSAQRASPSAPPPTTGPKTTKSAEGQDGRQKKEGPIFRMVLIMGLLGGFLRAVSSLVKYVGNGQLLRRWVLYYVLMPLEGMGVAVVMYLTVRIGLVAASTNVMTAKDLNVVAIYAFAVMAGLFSKQALENFSALFDTLFRRVQARDPLRDGAAASPPAPSLQQPPVAPTTPEAQSKPASGSTAPSSPPSSPPKSPP
jgi:cytochrome c oxidase subunit IV